MSASGVGRLVGRRKVESVRRVHRAFTLIEVLIAIALVVALLGMMFGFLFDMLNSRAGALEHARQQQAASTLIRQLDADLTTCIIGDSSNGDGVRGDQRRLRVLSRGVAASIAGQGLDDPDLFGDLQFTEYRFDPQESTIVLRRGPISRGAEEMVNDEVLGGPIHKVRFRYHDGTAWRGSFASLAAKRRPVAIEVAVWFKPVPGDEVDDVVASPLAEEASDSFASEPRLNDGERSDAAAPPDRVRIFLIPNAASDHVDGDDGGESAAHGDEASTTAPAATKPADSKEGT